MAVDPQLTQTIELLRRAQAGNAEALDALFQKYYERVRRVVRMRLGRQLRSRLDSGDILQETFLAALKSFDRFEVRDESAFVHWLSRIAEHQIRDAADYHGAQKRDMARQVPLDAGDDSRRLGIDLVSQGMLPAEAVSRDEDTALLEDCLADMPDEYRELIIMREYVGASWETIAEETGRPSPDAARMKHSTAMVELAKRIRRARSD